MVGTTPLRVLVRARASATWPAYAPDRRRLHASTSSSATTASRIRATRWTSSPFRTSRRARWRTSAPSRFRETALLVDEAAASHSDLERIADVVAHELAHMWFGDLVTMSVVERHLAQRGVRHLHGDARGPRLEAGVGALGELRRLRAAAAMGVDGLHASRPIEYDVRAPRDCEAMFDLLTYEKGASVLRMLEQHIGPDAFREGVRLYLRWHEYENAETDRPLEGARRGVRPAHPGGHGRLGLPPGLPAGAGPCRRAEAAPDPAALHVPRRSAAGSDDEPAHLWRVPVTVRASVAGKVVEQKLLSSPPPRTTRASRPRRSWVVVNAGGHGFYRVGYAPALLEPPDGRPGRPRAARALRPGLATASPSPRRATSRRRRSWTSPSGSATRRDRNVWAVVIGALAYVNRAIDDDARSGLEAFVREPGRPAARRARLDCPSRGRTS